MDGTSQATSAPEVLYTDVYCGFYLFVVALSFLRQTMKKVDSGRRVNDNFTVRIPSFSDATAKEMLERAGGILKGNVRCYEMWIVWPFPANVPVTQAVNKGVMKAYGLGGQVIKEQIAAAVTADPNVSPAMLSPQHTMDGSRGQNFLCVQITIDQAAELSLEETDVIMARFFVFVAWLFTNTVEDALYQTAKENKTKVPAKDFPGVALRLKPSSPADKGFLRLCAENKKRAMENKPLFSEEDFPLLSNAAAAATARRQKFSWPKGKGKPAGRTCMYGASDSK